MTDKELDRARAHGGFADLVDYHLTDWREGSATVALRVATSHLNRSKVMHGGVLSTLIDTACGYSGCYSEDPAKPRRAFTLSLTCQFIAAAMEGDRLTAVAEVTGGGQSIFFSRCEVTRADGTVVGAGEGVFKYLKTAGSREAR